MWHQWFYLVVTSRHTIYHICHVMLVTFCWKLYTHTMKYTIYHICWNLHMHHMDRKVRSWIDPEVLILCHVWERFESTWKNIYIHVLDAQNEHPTENGIYNPKEEYQAAYIPYYSTRLNFKYKAVAKYFAFSKNKTGKITYKILP